ncbi:MAG: hypothetical protein H0U41_06935, partial [Actinobacteria bacterium]|nr:hypothetical protein [Actinomycetota bacterium]
VILRPVAVLSFYCLRLRDQLFIIPLRLNLRIIMSCVPERVAGLGGHYPALRL